MTNFTTLLTQTLLNNEKCSDSFEQVVNELFRMTLENSLNEILKTELTAFLDYEMYQRSDNPDSRNGFSSRKLATSFGTLNLHIPRDRLGLFSSQLIQKYARDDGFASKAILKMFDLGMTNRDISKLVEELYGQKYSRSTITNITNTVVSNIQAFKNRPLNKEYAVVYIDATRMSLRRDTVAKEAVNIAVGITLEGTKEILGYSITPEESATEWKLLLSSLKERGLEKVGLFCTDGLHGMEEVLGELFPSSKIQRCLLHVSRNIAAKVRVKDRAEILDDFKSVYTSKDKNEAEEELKKFETKWKGKYPKVIECLENNINLLTFFEYPKSVRSSIYTTNIIESYNKQLKRKFKVKEQFPTEKSMEKYLVSQFEQYNTKFMSRIHKGFGQTVRTDWIKE